MRKELFGDMTNKQIVEEVVGSIAFFVMIVSLIGLYIVL